MCILFFILNEKAKSDEYKLICASNRDEFYERPAQIAGRWKEDQYIIGGRDMEPGREGGTWLAISTKNHTFKCAALLNVPGEKEQKDALPRGTIVNEYLKDSTSNTEYIQKFVNSDKKFNSFNLVTIEISEKDARPIHYSNVSNSSCVWPQNEVLGFSNSLTQCPLQKVNSGKEKFRDIINQQNQTQDKLVENLMKLLCNREKNWPDEELHRRRPLWGESLSSICVKMPEAKYGSRTRTVILVDANNKVDFYEETMASADPDGEWTQTHIETKF